MPTELKRKTTVVAIERSTYRVTAAQAAELARMAQDRDRDGVDEVLGDLFMVQDTKVVQLTVGRRTFRFRK